MTDNHKEHRVTNETPTVDELEAKIAAERAELAAERLVTPAEPASGYDISPALDPDDELEEDDETPATPNALTAFLVVVQPDGSAFATSELHKLTEILTQREATIPDMRRACQDVVFDVCAMQTAQQTVGLMQQQAQAMAEEQRNQKIAQKLASKGIHVPTAARR